MRYIRFKDGEFLKYSVKLPFSDEHSSFGINTDFAVLKKHGYFKFIEKKPDCDVFTQKIKNVKIVKISEDEASVDYEYEMLTEQEQIQKFGKKADVIKLEQSIKDTEEYIKKAILLGNDSVLPELRGELEILYVELENKKGE